MRILENESSEQKKYWKFLFRNSNFGVISMDEDARIVKKLKYGLAMPLEF